MPAKDQQGNQAEPNPPPSGTRWDVVWIAIFAGIVAGMQVGKVPPVLPQLIQDLSIGPITAGWIVSTFNLLGATLGVVTGLVATRVDPRVVVATGLVMLALGAAAGALATGPAGLILARTVAGVGLVTIAVSAPRLIVNAAEPRDFPRALGIWGIYTPAGIALAMLLTPLIVGRVGWRGVWLANALAVAVFLVLFLRTTAPDRWTHAERKNPGLSWQTVADTLRRPGPWLLGAVFGCYTLQFFALMSWLPTYLIDVLGYETGRAATVTAAVVAANVVGNLLGAGLLHRGWPRWRLQLGSLIVTSLCGAAVFASGYPGAVKILLAFVFNLAGGLLPAATLAASAAHASSRGQVAAVNGIIVQGANLGSLSGAPALAWLVTWFGGWRASIWLMFTAGAMGCILVASVWWVERRGRSVRNRPA
jgi:predicted MFS family arabinose efflux permease